MRRREYRSRVPDVPVETRPPVQAALFDPGKPIGAANFSLRGKSVTEFNRRCRRSKVELYRLVGSQQRERL
jgi:hypothetical protein